jgi:hypothetical protein
MGLFRKKPVMIEAVQFFGLDVAENGCYNIHFDTKDALPKWLRDALVDDVVFPIANGIDNLYVKTRKGLMEAAEGDWIIRGPNNEIYPCKPDIFAMTYEPVDEQDVEVTGVAI